MKITKFALAFIALLFLYDVAHGCRCPPRKPSANIPRSVAVFSGKVINVTFKQPPYEVGRYAVTFEVERVWQGEIKKQTVLITRASSCDVRFREGERYLVFASVLYDGSGLTTHKCSRTGLVADRKEDIELLGEGEVPEGGEIARQFVARAKHNNPFNRASN
jgi:hypothetical protein